ncbi:3-hydroxyisobutyrate dehydrogenase [Elioraea sp.]|uniref:3-hydroxyisobutyrate dehydrogenase n=1 Tax=Elioraea sp. TaxID=2185103 RepID=UPI0021DE6CCF|nr:3-hydroxyisobutyrate dehydrogenase [Elioraea sp.]GIX09498.1 MAG: 3-hydroxyisobutyrate dehydrogenase [Elioraea sp.]
MARIGFIGLGNMGAPMARNLVRAGHELRVFDVFPDRTGRLVAEGAAAAETPAGVAEGAEAIITMLPSGREVRAVYGGPGGLIEAAARGTLLIDCSTIDVATAREMAALAHEGGLAMIDAPVSGGVGGAEAATLTFMVGGAEAEVARARPILQAMGKAVVRAGEAGAGQAAKICNNMILGISMIAVCEAFVLAERLGLDHQALFDIASKSSGQCWSLTSYCPVPGPVPASPANRGYAPGFTAQMMLKDLDLAQEAARASSAETELGRHAAELYRRFVEGSGATVDFSGIIRMIRGGA